MSQADDIYGEYDDEGNYYPYSIYGGGSGSVGGDGTLTFNVDGTGDYPETSGGGFDYYNNPFPTGGGQNYFINPGKTGGINTAGTGGGTPTIPPGGNSTTNNNTQNNTQNNSNVLAQSVGLPSVSPISSGVPQSPASSFRPNMISPGGGLREGQPPPMPSPHAPPTLHPDKPTDWSSAGFGAATPSQGNPASQKSTLSKIGGAIGNLTGINQTAKRYKGIYDSLKPQKTRTPDEINAEMYRDLYGGQ